MQGFISKSTLNFLNFGLNFLSRVPTNLLIEYVHPKSSKFLEVPNRYTNYNYIQVYIHTCIDSQYMYVCAIVKALTFQYPKKRKRNIFFLKKRIEIRTDVLIKASIHHYPH